MIAVADHFTRAVDHHYVTVHERGVVGCQKQGGICNVFDATPTAHWVGDANLLGCFGEVVGTSGCKPCGESRDCSTGCDRIRAYAVSSEFRRNRLSQANDAVFCRCVDVGSETRAETRRAGCVDDRPRMTVRIATLGDHRARGVLDAVEHTAQQHVD